MATQRAYNYDRAYETTAPKKRPEPKRARETELREVVKGQQIIRIQNEKKSNRIMIRVLALLLPAFMMFAIAEKSRAELTMAKNEYERVKEAYVFAQAKNRELHVELNNVIGAVNIDKIAVEELGLVKVTPGNEIYLDTVEGNKVIFSQDK